MAESGAIIPSPLTYGGVQTVITIAGVKDNNNGKYTISWHAEVQERMCDQYHYTLSVSTSTQGTVYSEYRETSSGSVQNFSTVASWDGSFDVTRTTADQVVSVSCSATFDKGASGSATESTTVPAAESQPITYIVSYNITGGRNAPAPQIKTHGSSLTLSSDKPTRTGYNFGGWAKEIGSTTVAYSSGSKYEVDADITLYAIWIPIATITILYDANGGTGAPSAQTTVPGVKIRLSSTAPTRKNYTFVGWQRMTGSDTTVYRSGSEYTVGNYTSNDSISFHAVWYQPPAYVWANVGTGKYAGIWINKGDKKGYNGIFVSTG